jgi:hypothetical protein
MIKDTNKRAWPLLKITTPVVQPVRFAGGLFFMSVPEEKSTIALCFYRVAI